MKAVIRWYVVGMQLAVFHRIAKLWQFVSALDYGWVLDNAKYLAVKLLHRKRILIFDAETEHQYQYVREIAKALSDRFVILWSVSIDPRDKHSPSRLIESDGYAKGSILFPGLLRLPIWGFVAKTFVSSTAWTRVPRGVPNRVQIFHGLSNKKILEENVLNFNHLFLTGDVLYQRYMEFCAEHPGRCAEQRVWKVGYPYSDRLFNGPEYNKDQVLQEIGAEKPVTVMYAPTWEEESSLFLHGKRVVEVLRTMDANVLVRLHPMVLRRNAPDRVRRVVREVLEVPGVIDVTSMDYAKCFAATDVLVTDVSGVGFEFILTLKPVVFMDVPAFFDRYGREGIHHSGRVGPIVGRAEELPTAIRTVLDPRTDRWAAGRRELASRLVYNPGRGVEVAANTIARIDRGQA